MVSRVTELEMKTVYLQLKRINGGIYTVMKLIKISDLCASVVHCCRIVLRVIVHHSPEEVTRSLKIPC